MDGDISYSANTGYQTSTRLPAIDKDNFDYDSLMEWFWGNSKGADIEFQGGRYPRTAEIASQNHLSRIL